MNKTYFLSVLASGMALLLLPAQAARNVAEKQADRFAQQEKSPAVHVDIDREPDAEMDIDMDVESDMNMDIEEPQVDMDADRDEPEMDADSDQEDVDHEDVDNDEPSLTEHEQEKIEKTFAMPAGTGRRTLELHSAAPAAPPSCECARTCRSARGAVPPACARAP